MARKVRPVGPNTLALIEDARIDLACEVLVAREGEYEPDFSFCHAAPNPADDQAVSDFRDMLVETLSDFDADELRPVEQRCRRIRALADGKGTTSLTTIVDRQSTDDEAEEFENQPDPLCRSIWSYLNTRHTFEDAESFHFARKFREFGKLYDAFEVELDKSVDVDAASIDETALAIRITKLLELKTNCTVRAVDLPPTAEYPASLMLIVRHGGPLSSVHDHRRDGRRGTIYFRPPNEATLIYTPSTHQIEVCADSPVVRQEIAGSFAEVALGHDVSQKPLTWKRYNLSRFRASLRLDPPKVSGYAISFARVLEAEVRLGTWRRKLLLKVAVDDDIEDVAKRYLRPDNIFRRADGFSRIGIAVAYSRVGDERERTLNITISGTKSCNLQSNRDPDERGLGYALLEAWGILSAFKQIDPNDLRVMFPHLIDLHDRFEDEVSGAYLHERGLDADRLIQGGLLERRGRQDVVLIDDDDIGGEGTIKPSARAGMVRTIGAFGERGGERPASDLEMYEINRQWLHETVVLMLKPLLTKRTSQVLDPDLTLLGAMQIGGAEVPVYFGRRLYDLKTLERLDLALRARNQAGVGIVLAASPMMPSHLGPNVVVPLLSNIAPEDEDIVVSRDGLELAFRSNFALARGGGAAQVLRSGKQSATLHIPGKDALTLLGKEQIDIFERLVAAQRAGSPDLHVKELMAGLSARSPQQAFRPKSWETIKDVYICKGAKRGYWCLVVDGSTPDAAV